MINESNIRSFSEAFLPWYRSLDTRKIIKAAKIILILGFLLGFFSGNAGLFASFGAVVTIMGLLLLIESKAITNLEEFKREVIKDLGVGTTSSVDSLSPDEIDKASDNIRRQMQRETTGVIISIIGTLVWAFGEYVPTLCSFNN